MCAGSDSSSFFSLNDSLPGFGARTRLGSFGATGSVATAPGLPAFGFAGAPFVTGDGVARFREEGAVVADEQDGSVEAADQLLQQLQRLDIQVVRRLIEDQYVRGTREQPREQEPVALASGQQLDRRLGALTRKQKVGEIADHMP